jgi:hypothetical protein
MRSTSAPCAAYDAPEEEEEGGEGAEAEDQQQEVPAVMTLGPARAPQPYVALALSHAEVQTLPLAKWLVKPCKDELARLRSIAARML